MQPSNYTVCYGYKDKFELTVGEAQQLIKAAEAGAKIVKFSDRVLSTSFTWLVPSTQTKTRELTSKEVGLVETIAEWLSRDVHNLNMNYQSCYSFAKRLVTANAEEAKSLYDHWANGAYPNARKFLTEGKQAMGEAEEAFSGVKQIGGGL